MKRKDYVFLADMVIEQLRFDEAGGLLVRNVVSAWLDRHCASFDPDKFDAYINTRL